MKKYAISLLIIIIAISLCSCGMSSGIAGNWICQEVHNGYPDQMTLKNDGTGMVDGISCNWTTNHGELTITAGIFGTMTYEYKMQGNNLCLNKYLYDKK